MGGQAPNRNAEFQFVGLLVIGITQSLLPWEKVSAKLTDVGAQYIYPHISQKSQIFASFSPGRSLWYKAYNGSINRDICIKSKKK